MLVIFLISIYDLFLLKYFLEQIKNCPAYDRALVSLNLLCLLSSGLFTVGTGISPVQR